jgi:hypothetical protein
MKRITPLVLLFAVLGFGGCAKKENGGKQEAKSSTPAMQSAVSPQLLSLYPAKNEVPGWAMKETPRSFKPANLYEFIDGAADGYLTYGFQEVATADYAQESSGFQAVIDIYQMQDPLNAFGIYSEERNPEYSFMKIGNEGYSGGTSVNFWSGPYYVKITTFDEKDALKQEMTKLAAAVAGKVTVPGAEPIEVSYFPKKDLLPHSTTYIPRDVLAQSYLTNGFEAKYKSGDKESKLVLISLDSPSAAQAALARYRQFESTDGRTAKDLKTPGDGGFSGKDSFYGNMLAVRAGRNLVVALGMASEDTGKKMAAELLGNIK